MAVISNLKKHFTHGRTVKEFAILDIEEKKTKQNSIKI